MKILILTTNIGRTAPGIVFERLIYGLSAMHDLDVITAENDGTIDLSKASLTVIPRKKGVSSRVDKALFSIFGVDLKDLGWVRKVVSQVKKSHPEKYDLVFSMAAYGHYGAIMAGEKISASWSKRHFVYSVDAIPAPIGWLKNELIYKKTRKLVRKYLADVDGLFSANEQMLDFQLNIIEPRKKIVSDVIFNPSFGGIKQYDLPAHDLEIFLYTGGIYGQRKPEYLLGAFKKLLRDHPNARLQFVGTVIREENFSMFTEEERKKITIHGFAADLQPFYEQATALIDIDADLPDDIYLSSKMTNYITVNRPIICETGINSPSRNLFRQIPSILQCDHDVNAIELAMRTAIEQKGKMDFSDRKEVIRLFELENIIAKINLYIHEDQR